MECPSRRCHERHSTDWLACIWPISPARRSSTYVALPSTLCAPAAVIGLPHRSITYCTCLGVVASAGASSRRSTDGPRRPTVGRLPARPWSSWSNWTRGTSRRWQQRPLRRRVVRDLRPREFFCDSLYLRHEGVRRDAEQAPEDDDRYREDSDHSGDERRSPSSRPMLAHADFTLQVTSAS